MNRSFRNALFIVLGLAFAFALMKSIYCPQWPRRLSRELLRREYNPASDITFRFKGIVADGPGPGESRVGWSDFTSSDCILVEKGSYQFTSPEAAATQLLEWKKSGSRIIVETPARAPNLEKRVVLQTMENGDFIVLAVDTDSASVVSSVRSHSLAHALLFESQDKAGRIRSNRLSSDPLVLDNLYAVLSCK